ncbi:hypothetical protein C5749_07920 [Sphingobacterium gobiense]|uniref:Uncharacterized protein n=2 Tax=Sphingobacterium gobiense TaxID=1382456 RepID=A0A2S9JVF4_9SPHI|nr:hypothetical protein C5749_07920 [Sphingobacterium gobiense]
MKIFTLIMPALFFLTSFDVSILDKVRTNYNAFLSDKALCQQTITELEKTKDNSVTLLGYLGGLQTIRANHVFSPISKLNTFNKGKNNIEQAIKKDPNNAELRFIRLSVQKNAPSFLGYKSNIKEDTEFIKKNRNQINSDILKKNMEKLLKD